MTPLETAIQLALQYHHGQVNKHDGEPYILHPFRIATSLKNDGFSEAHQAVAWLHDSLEDTDISQTLLIDSLPQEIVHGIILLTKVKGESNMNYYLRVKKDDLARTVKMYDVMDNFSRNHKVVDIDTRERLAKKYSQALDVLRGL